MNISKINIKCKFFIFYKILNNVYIFSTIPT